MKVLTIFQPLIAVSMMQTSVLAFAPTSFSSKPGVMKNPISGQSSVLQRDIPASTLPPIITTSTALSATELVPELVPDLVVGYGIIVAACTPYVLGVIFKDFFNESFFLPIYNDDTLGREAEIGWKVRYATLALALTTLAFLEVYLVPDCDAVKVLRDSYVLWAIFYTEATLKIRREATADPPILANPSGRTGIQIWHLTVVLVLWADVIDSYSGNAITNFIKNVFTF